MRGMSVPAMMTRVETALVKAARQPGGVSAGGPIFVHTEGDDELGIAGLRDPATIKVEFHSGSDRPVVGDVIRFGKRAVRRGLRWYTTPPWDQQTRFNHATLDLIEKLRLQNERLANEVAELNRRLLRAKTEDEGDEADAGP
ncbi:MAG: hypothetical protein QOE93_1083 [Actinomycetota bacterium]|jgi:hypothetical protein|nr:hypothetical protein [Actinomycetota bacterium]